MITVLYWNAKYFIRNTTIEFVIRLKIAWLDLTAAGLRFKVRLFDTKFINLLGLSDTRWYSSAVLELIFAHHCNSFHSVRSARYRATVEPSILSKHDYTTM